MKKLQVFDPAMCCSSGVCGPSVDPTLPRFAADLDWLKSKGVDVERFNLAQQVGAFTGNSQVKHMLNTHGSKCLPILIVNNEVVATGGYPSRLDLANFLAIDYEPGPVFKTKNPDLVGITAKRG